MKHTTAPFHWRRAITPRGSLSTTWTHNSLVLRRRYTDKRTFLRRHWRESYFHTQASSSPAPFRMGCSPCSPFEPAKEQLTVKGSDMYDFMLWVMTEFWCGKWNGRWSGCLLWVPDSRVIFSHWSTQESDIQSLKHTAEWYSVMKTNNQTKINCGKQTSDCTPSTPSCNTY